MKGRTRTRKQLTLNSLAIYTCKIKNGGCAKTSLLGNKICLRKGETHPGAKRSTALSCLTVKRVITAADIPASGELRIATGSIVTPSARDLARDRAVKITEVAPDQIDTTTPPEKIVALGSDHGGFVLKERLKPILEEFALTIQDIGVHEEKPADYPDIARQVAELVANGQASRGIIIDGAGIGSCIVANKFPGIRAALCYDRASARNSREHNDSNVLTLGGRLLTATQAEDVLRVWLTTPFVGGRHAARVQKIIDIEKAIKNWTPPS